MHQELMPLDCIITAMQKAEASTRSMLQTPMRPPQSWALTNWDSHSLWPIHDV